MLRRSLTFGVGSGGGIEIMLNTDPDFQDKDVGSVSSL